MEDFVGKVSAYKPCAKSCMQVEIMKQLVLNLLADIDILVRGP